MAIRVALNGFGRIGRQVVRIALDRDSFELKHINSPMAPEYMKYLLEHDTVHGRFKGTCEIEGDGLKINGAQVSLTATRDPTEIPWKDVSHRCSRLADNNTAHFHVCLYVFNFDAYRLVSSTCASPPVPSPPPRAA